MLGSVIDVIVIVYYVSMCTATRGCVLRAPLATHTHSVSLALVRSFAGVEGRGGADLTKVEA